MQRSSLALYLALSVFVILAGAWPSLSSGALNLKSPAAPAEVEHDWLLGHVMKSREKRHAEVSDPEGFPDDVDEDMRCHECSLPPAFHRMGVTLRSLEFKTLSQLLQSHCPVPEDLLMICLPSACQQFYAKDLLGAMFDVLQWACSHRAQFAAHDACWTRQFTNEMYQCVIDGPERNARSCVSLRLRTVDSCTPEAQDFFMQFFDFIRSIT